MLPYLVLNAYNLHDASWPAEAICIVFGVVVLVPALILFLLVWPWLVGKRWADALPAELMITIAKKYSDKIQIAFKPHPHLFRELCEHKEWGETKTRDYYNQWANMENTQLETGEFIDLFMTSDAMIHDSGSFCVEYHYSGNPVMYVADNFEKQVEAMADFGKLAMQQHYVGKTEEDIVDFIEKLGVIGEKLSCIVSALGKAHITVREPCTALLNDSVFNAEVDDFTVS